MQAPAWPWCATCTAQRKKLLAIGLPLVAVGVLCFAGGIAANSDSSPIFVLLGIVVLLAGTVVAGRGGQVPMTGAMVSGDGRYVEVKRAATASSWP